MQAEYRIVSLCPSNTELIVALGLEPYLVGVDNYSDFPEDVLNGLPRLGPDLNIDINAVVALQPHLVVSSLSVPGMEKVVDAVESAGLRQIVLSPHSLHDMYADLRRLGQSVPASLLQQQPEEVIERLQQRVTRVAAWASHNIASTEGLKLYWEWWPQPVFSPASGNWLTELSQLAGAENIFAKAEGDSVQDDGSRVTHRNPDWFLAVWTGVPQHKVPLQKILHRGGPWEETTAFQKKQIYILSEGLFCRPSPRLIDGLEQLTGLLYPQAVENLGLLQPQAYAPIRTADGSWLE